MPGGATKRKATTTSGSALFRRQKIQDQAKPAGARTRSDGIWIYPKRTFSISWRRTPQAGGVATGDPAHPAPTGSRPPTPEANQGQETKLHHLPSPTHP